MNRTGIVALGGIAVLLLGLAAWRVHGPRSTGPAVDASAAVPEIARQVVPGRRVIFLGLDGADWGLLDPYIARGVMPAMARLVREGSSGTLTTIQPPLSPLIWTSMLTGVSPLEHRVLDFLRVNPVSRQREPITSDERQVPAVWNMATAAGKRVGALGFWATYPAEAVNGLIVSDRLFTFLYSESAPPPGVVFPTALEGWAREMLARSENEIGYDELKRMLPWLGEEEYREAAATTDPYAHPVSALRRVLIETRVYDALARDWFVRGNADLLLVYVQGTDSIGHVFAPYAPPRQPSIPESDYERFSQVPERYFALVDRLLDGYMQLAEATDSVLMLASDHGFQWGEGRPAALSSVANATAARWHTENGIYLLWGRGIPASAGHVGRGTVEQVCSTLMALLGLPAGTGLTGPALAGTPPLSAGTVDYRRHYAPGVMARPSSSAASGVDEDTVAKLRALGYVGAAPAGGRTIGTRTAGSFNNEALLLRQQGRTQEAVDAFEQALAVDPNLASALWNLSDLLFAQNASLDRSDALLIRAFANGLPEGTRYVIGRAIGYERGGRIDRSIRLLTEAAGARSDEAEVWLFRGRYRMETGDCAGALPDFQRATGLDSDNAAAFASLGVAQLCAGDPAAARSSFERSLALDPDQPKVREYLQTARRGAR